MAKPIAKPIIALYLHHTSIPRFQGFANSIFLGYFWSAHIIQILELESTFILGVPTLYEPTRPYKIFKTILILVNLDTMATNPTRKTNWRINILDSVLSYVPHAVGDYQTRVFKALGTWSITAWQLLSWSSPRQQIRLKGGMLCYLLSC